MVRAIAAGFEAKDTGWDAWRMLFRARREAFKMGGGGFSLREWEEWRVGEQRLADMHIYGQKIECERLREGLVAQNQNHTSSSSP